MKLHNFDFFVQDLADYLQINAFYGDCEGKNYIIYRSDDVFTREITYAVRSGRKTVTQFTTKSTNCIEEQMYSCSFGNLVDRAKLPCEDVKSILGTSEIDEDSKADIIIHLLAVQDDHFKNVIESFGLPLTDYEREARQLLIAAGFEP